MVSLVIVALKGRVHDCQVYISQTKYFLKGNARSMTLKLYYELL